MEGDSNQGGANQGGSTIPNSFEGVTITQPGPKTTIIAPGSQLSPDMFSRTAQEFVKAKGKPAPVEGVKGQSQPIVDPGSGSGDFQDDLDDSQDDLDDSQDGIEDSQDDLGDLGDDTQSFEPYHVDLGYEEGNLYTVTLPNGVTLDLPEDAIIENKVDGKVSQYKLGQQMSVASAEVAFSKRKADLDRKEAQIQAEVSNYRGEIESLRGSVKVFSDKLLSSENPVDALPELSRAFDLPQGQMAKKLLQAARILEAKIHQTKIEPRISGLNLGDPKQRETANRIAQDEYESEFSRMDRQFDQLKLEKEAEARAEKQRRDQEINNYVRQEARGFGLVDSDIQMGITLQKKRLASQGLEDSDDTRPVKEKIDEALLLAYGHKKGKLILEAIDKVNPELIENDALVGRLRKIVDPRAHSLEVVVDLVTDMISKTSTDRKKILAKNLATSVKRNYSSNGTSSRKPQVGNYESLQKRFGFSK